MGGLVVDGNPTFQNQLLHLQTRAHASLCQHFVQFGGFSHGRQHPFGHCQLGDLFVCRVAGNVTDPVVLGSIEYAVEHLGSPLIVVLGHTKCGAVAAALAGGHAEGNLGALLEHVHPGSNLPADAAAKSDAGVANNARRQVKNLTSQSAVIRELVKKGRVAVTGGVYSLDTGEVTWF